MVLKMKNIMNTKILMMVSLLALAACSSAKEQLGITRKPPDEFAVVKRAPLSMPPDYALTPPRPGAPRPQEQATSEQAKETLFGTTGGSAPAGSDSILLGKAGAQKARPGIRQTVDAENKELNKENIPVARRLFGLGGDPDEAPVSVVDAKKENERLQQNKAQGKPATAGDTPSVER
jgi:hypothetical protein